MMIVPAETPCLQCQIFRCCREQRPLIQDGTYIRGQKKRRSTMLGPLAPRDRSGEFVPRDDRRLTTVHDCLKAKMIEDSLKGMAISRCVPSGTVALCSAEEAHESGQIVLLCLTGI